MLDNLLLKTKYNTNIITIELLFEYPSNIEKAIQFRENMIKDGYDMPSAEALLFATHLLKKYNVQNKMSSFAVELVTLAIILVDKECIIPSVLFFNIITGLHLLPLEWTQDEEENIIKQYNLTEGHNYTNAFKDLCDRRKQGYIYIENLQEYPYLIEIKRSLWILFLYQVQELYLIHKYNVQVIYNTVLPFSKNIALFALFIQEKYINKFNTPPVILEQKIEQYLKETILPSIETAINELKYSKKNDQNKEDKNENK